MNISTLVQIGQILPKNIISDAIRSLFMALDSITYSLIGVFFSAVFSITKLEEMTIITELYDSIQSKVYVVIGIFMLFKVTISLLTYLANPDKINDKEMGASKLVTRIVTSLVLLIIVPTVIFPFLNDIQIPLLNTVGKIITGQANSIDGTSAFDQGQEAAETVMGTFFYVDSECDTSSEKLDNIFDNLQYVNDACEVTDNEGNSLGTDKTKYKYNYTFGVSNIVALVTIILLIIIAINVAIRAFKLMVLKILAPIPILSYIDPKSSKDGMFSSYTKLFVKTYLDLFIQFGVFYLVIVILEKIIELQTSLPTIVTTGVEYLKNDPTGISFIFVFIGLLVFAIMAPKFIKKALNIKDSEFGSGLAGILTTGAMVAGTTGAAVSGFTTSAANGGGFLKNMGAGIAGAIGGITSGAKAGFASGKTDSSKVLSSINDYNARARANAGSTFLGRTGTTLSNIFLGTNRAEQLETEIQNMEDATKAISTVLDRANGEMKKSLSTFGSVSKGSNMFTNYKEFAAAYAESKATGKDYVDYIGRDQNGNVTGTYRMSFQEAEKNIGWIEKENEANYIDQIRNGTLLAPDGSLQDDKLLKTYMEDANAKLDGLHLSVGTPTSAVTRKDMKDIQDDISFLSTNKRRELQTAKADAGAVKNKK